MYIYIYVYDTFNNNKPTRRFCADIRIEYKNKLMSLFSKSDIEWLFTILQREICNDDGYVTLDNYTSLYLATVGWLVSH